MANFMEACIKAAGRGAAYIALAVVEVLLAYHLALTKSEALTGFATVLGVVNAAVYGGGMVKAAAEARANGNGVAK